MYRLANPCPETTKANNVCSDPEPSVNCKSLEWSEEKRGTSPELRGTSSRRDRLTRFCGPLHSLRANIMWGKSNRPTADCLLPPQLFHTAGQVQTSTADEFLASNCFGWSWKLNQMKSFSSTLLNATLKRQHLFVIYYWIYLSIVSKDIKNLFTVINPIERTF